MPRLTRNQLLFTGIAIALTIAFVIYLYRLLSAGRFGEIPPLAIGFGVAMFVAGLACGATDPVAKSRGDLGFGYHAITFVVVAVIGLSAAALNGQPLWPQAVGLLGWALGLWIHYTVSQRSLKGIPRDEAFP